MPKATDALHSDQITTSQAGIAKRVEGRDARAQEGGGLCRRQLVWYGRDAARLSDHHLRIASIHGGTRYHGVLTIHDVSASARFAYPVFATEEADPNSLTDFPLGHATAQGVSSTNDFVPWHSRQLQTRIHAGDRGRIGVTDSAGFHANSNLTRRRLGE